VSEPSPGLTRRPIAARNSRWAPRLAAWLAAHGVRPNAISASSMVFSAGSAAAFVAAGTATGGLRAGLLALAAIGLPLRLLANLLDGLVAVEGGLRSKSGEIWNELPDRISDALVFVAAGYATPGALSSTLGWAMAAVAILTAYVRSLGVQAGAAPQFCGPCAKQQRITLLGLGTGLAAVAALSGNASPVLPATLALVLAGSLLTTARRVGRIVRELEGRGMSSGGPAGGPA
jgi:phosphatidylglycerophosphate synthase